MLSDEQLRLLHDWQVLLGAVLVGICLLLLLAALLYAVNRRHDAQTRWLRVALGLEFRQVAWYALNVHAEVLRLLPPVNPNLGGPTRTLKDLQGVMQFPDPAIYSHSGAGVGSLGKRATQVISFYFGLWSLRDSVMNLWTSSAVERLHLSVPSSQLLDIAESLLTLLEAASGLLPYLEGKDDVRPDGQFAADLAASQQRLKALRRSYSHRS